MGELPTEHSSVDAHGIRPPDAYVIDQRETPEGFVVLVLEGEFDLAAVPSLREQIESALDRAPRGVVLDLGEVTFVDSSGLRELLRARTAYGDAGKGFALAAPQPPVIRLFELTGVTNAIISAPTVERAIRLLDGKP
jgi:anti-sigma B factor antagonist